MGMRLRHDFRESKLPKGTIRNRDEEHWNPGEDVANHGVTYLGFAQ